MYRSQEILQIFYKKNLSKDIINYILHLEREKIYVGEDWQFEFSRTLSRLTQMSRYHLP